MFSFKKKKIEPTAEKAESVQADTSRPQADDFAYAQLDASIHDKKFQTKPTTFFKDAMKRFVKNRSSVVATAILLTLISMAIIVPLADQNNIKTDQKISAYLPPRWWGVNKNGFLDGTGFVSDAVIDPDTNELAAKLDGDGKKTSTYDYYERAIIAGTKTTRVVQYNVMSKIILAYGRGGSIIFTDGDSAKNGKMTSPNFDYVMADDATFDVTFDSTMAKASPKTVYRPILMADYNSDSTYDETIALSNFTDSTNALSLTGITAAVSASNAYQSAGAPASFKASFGFEVQASATSSPSIYLEKVVATSANGKMDLSSVAFTDATQKMASKTPYSARANGQVSLANSKVILASFRYDYYEAAFGVYTDTMDPDTINAFIKKGWMTYEFVDHGSATGDYPAGAFSLTKEGETYCPIRSVKGEYYSSFSGITTRTLTCEISLYRLDYYKGLIPSCQYPKYFFGTDSSGFDFFKVVFSGLLTSLELGLLSAVINIVIGLIWGAISGYFGGWTDILMERFTEILGGVPWIVMMTLIILVMKSSFWTFLLALCLTGWMGVAGLTRSQFYRYKGREYVLASRTLGASDARLIFKHILPNGIGTIVTSTAFMIPSVIFSEATISYLLPGLLSFGGKTSFGVTLSYAQEDIQTHPYLIVSASIVMMLIMISFNLFGNGLRDAFNPSLKGSED